VSLAGTFPLGLYKEIAINNSSGVKKLNARESSRSVLCVPGYGNNVYTLMKGVGHFPS
jgi:hypothetical protein